MTFKPLLAEKLTEKDFEKVKFPVYASPKLDGIRVMVRDGQLMTRNMKKVPNKHIFAELSKPEYEGFDGEIIVGDPRDKACYKKTSSGVMSHDGEPEFTFFVFDLFNIVEPYVERYKQLMDKVPVGDTRFTVLNQKLVDSVEAMKAFEEHCLLEGYEGIMLRSTNGPYKQGRATLNSGILLKLKRFSDDEALIVGFQERMHNGNEATKNALGHTERSTHKENMVGRNDLGALWVAYPKKGYTLEDVKEDHLKAFKWGGGFDNVISSKTKLDAFNEGNGKFVLFTVGSGFTDSERDTVWKDREPYLQRKITFKYFSYGDYNIPRFPTFVGFREDI